MEDKHMCIGLEMTVQGKEARSFSGWRGSSCPYVPGGEMGEMGRCVDLGDKVRAHGDGAL